MSNEDTGRLIELITDELYDVEVSEGCLCRECCESRATMVVGELLAKYHITPIGAEETK